MEDLYSDDENFQSQWSSRQQKSQGIVALKGLPYTYKTRLAELISEWATCPVFCIDDFLGYQNKPAAAYEFTPSGVAKDEDESERHNQHAFTSLCTVAKRHLDPKFSRRVFGSVVVKSRLVSQFEIYKLVDLAHMMQLRKNRVFPLLIIECQMRNEFRWEKRLQFFANRVRDWYRPMSWKEIVQIRDDYTAQSQDWDAHLRRLVNSLDDPPVVRWLVVDPLTDLNFTPTDKLVGDLRVGGFFDAVTFLLAAGKDELKNQNPFVVEFDELRRFLFDKKLNSLTSRGRSKYLCHRGDCLFKLVEAIENNSSYEIEFCGVCQGQVSGPAYTCYFCTLTLHKSCAERINFKNTSSPFSDTPILDFFYYYGRQFPEFHACKSCIEQGRAFSNKCGSCLFETHLKCHLVPTIINHDCHQHFLSIQFRAHSFVCRACGTNYTAYSYGCKRCAVYYHLHCASLFVEFGHEHGGHEHVMKLMYSRDGMEPEESYWCDFCYVDMDPQCWFYCCQECPYYMVDPDCAGGYDKTYKDMMSFLELKLKCVGL